jgi:AAA+ ATPase superfamily predicted ATPase
MGIIGRVREQEELNKYFNSGKPEFVAIVGRRRVGKTFLVREMFHQDMAFYFSGLVGKNVSTDYQLSLFDNTIAEYGGNADSSSKNWADAFRKLKKLLGEPREQRQVVFIDELPWLDSYKSDFLPALDFFWNTFASRRSDIMLIVCGSSAAWIVKNLFENKGGLHNRITGRIWLAPFTLAESEAFFDSIGVVMNRHQMAESHMIFGGIPFYLNMFDKKFGLTQNVDKLLFTSNAPLRNEFNEVYSSLFRSSERHMKIVRTLAQTKSGKTRDEIIETSGIPGGGNLTKTLNELEQCGFIERYNDFTKQKNSAYYRLIDPFSLFWLKYVSENHSKDEYYWTNLIDDGGRRAWSGHAFEMLCLRHLPQIKRKLGISGISTEAFSWKSKKMKPGAQIDLIISRKDGVLNLCEMKYSLHPITLSANDEKNLQNKRIAFLSETGANKAIHITLVSTYGLAEAGYRASVQSEVTIDDLFSDG